MHGRIIFDLNFESPNNRYDRSIRGVKNHHATFRKCDVCSRNGPSEIRLRDGASTAACRETGTCVPPETRHVASPSIDGFGAPFHTWMVFTNHAMCAVDTSRRSQQPSDFNQHCVSSSCVR